MRRVVVLVFTLFGATVAAAQRVDLADETLRPTGRGSFVATLTGATLGAGAGLSAGVLLAPRSYGICDLGIGGGCTETIGTDGVLFIFASTVVGTTAGAVLGRHLTHGRQDIVGTVTGAAFGAVAGAVILAHTRTEKAVPIAIAISVPTGLVSTLLGWHQPRR